jgi:hypothetical protein
MRLVISKIFLKNSAYDEEVKYENTLSYNCNQEFELLHLKNSNLKVPSQYSEQMSSAEATRRENLNTEEAKQVEIRGQIPDLNDDKIEDIMNCQITRKYGDFYEEDKNTYWHCKSCLCSNTDPKRCMWYLIDNDMN